MTSSATLIRWSCRLQSGPLKCRQHIVHFTKTPVQHRLCVRGIRDDDRFVGVRKEQNGKWSATTLASFHQPTICRCSHHVLWPARFLAPVLANHRNASLSILHQESPRASLQLFINIGIARPCAVESRLSQRPPVDLTNLVWVHVNRCRGSSVENRSLSPKNRQGTPNVPKSCQYIQ